MTIFIILAIALCVFILKLNYNAGETNKAEELKIKEEIKKLKI